MNSLPNRQQASRDYPLNIKVDQYGRAWAGGQPLVCPLELPAGARGELCFNPDQAVLLLGPWGPDPRRYMILSGAVQALDEGRLSVMLGAEQPTLVVACGDGPAASRKPGQKVWLAIAGDALSFRD